MQLYVYQGGTFVDIANWKPVGSEGTVNWAKNGVLSHKQNWATGNGSYTISNVVRGLIPISDIELYKTYGVLFNDTENIISRKAPWDEVVQHLPGYFYLNGLGDISYEEMRIIYSERKSLKTGYSMSDIGVTNFGPSFSKGRTNLSPRITNVGGQNYRLDNISKGIASSNLEVFYLDVLANGCVMVLNQSFYNRPKLKRIACTMNVSECTNYGEFIHYSPNVEYIRLKKLKNNIDLPSRSLSNNSILFLIENEAAASPITVKLHADAYARAMADPQITAALAAHPNVSLASA